MIGGTLFKMLLDFVAKYWKAFACIGLVAGCYIYGHHKGWEAGKAADMAAVMKAEAKATALNTKNAALQKQLADKTQALTAADAKATARINSEPSTDCISKDPTFGAEMNSDPRNEKP